MSSDYSYRRKLRATEMLPAVAVGIGLGLAGFYVARLLLQRTPLLPRSAGTGTLDRDRQSRPRALISPRPPALGPPDD